MLTEVDIKRIMSTQIQLSEEKAEDTDIDCIDEFELLKCRMKILRYPKPMA